MSEITKVPNKILSRKVKEVSLEELKSGSLKGLFSEMKKAMLEHNGVGLSANQIGLDMSVFVIDENFAQEAGVPSVYVNPEITEFSRDKDEFEEGCLSIPEYYVPISRSKKIKIKFLDENGDKVKLKVRGFVARILQHETDHLQGFVIKDRVEKPVKKTK
jgi:peptide deformylase